MFLAATLDARAVQVVERRLLVRLADGSYAARTLHQRESLP
jgi:hypothetical protein